MTTDPVRQLCITDPTHTLPVYIHWRLPGLRHRSYLHIGLAKVHTRIWKPSRRSIAMALSRESSLRDILSRTSAGFAASRPPLMAPMPSRSWACQEAQRLCYQPGQTLTSTAPSRITPVSLPLRFSFLPSSIQPVAPTQPARQKQDFHSSTTSPSTMTPKPWS